jgi:hypothetical protein
VLILHVPWQRKSNGDTELQHAVSPPSRTRKHVRIESSTASIPPHPDAQHVLDPASERPTQAQSRALYADSPSFAASAGFPGANTNDDGLYTREAGRGREMPAQYTLGSSGRAPDTYAYTAALSPSTAPANPFSKTLASIEPPERGSGDDRTPTERAALGRNRASLDVEGFKNLLMTGRPSPRQPGQPPQASAASGLANAPIFESSSSTDTSSISRQSLFEPAHEPPSDSPRTSYEMAASEDDDRAVQVPEQKKGKKKPPPAPKHRHGKLVSSRQPQTVSFDSFAATDYVAPPAKSRESSDVHKPLPPTPIMSPLPLHLDTQDSTLEGISATSQRVSEPPSVSEILQPQKRMPPPVPLARRQSQLRTSAASSRSRSSSSLTIASQQSLDGPVSSPGQNINDPMLGVKSPPPPPPPRHGARFSNIGFSSANSSSTEIPQRSASVRTTESARRPSSPWRSTLDSESPTTVTGLERTNSTSSKRNSLLTNSGESTGSAMPPPPPPPRRRQSNRSSLEMQRPYNSASSPNESRRTSTEYRNYSPENRRPSTDSKRRTSVASESSLRHGYAPTDERTGNEFPLYSPNEEAENTLGANLDAVEQRSDSNNILDDMEKFQREIDALRTRFKQAE